LSFSEIKGLTLFNKFYSPDVDINHQKIITTDVLSHDSDYKNTLRWIGMMANRVNSDLSASTGVHNWQTVIKMLLVGATTVQIVSALYQDGFTSITKIVQHLEKWMEEKGYENIADFRGKLSMDNSTNLAEFERVQFMRNFGEYK
jgi:dihydroorotate dehydrogenase (fumarate)